MDDLISRQAAIDAVTDELDMIDHVPQWVFDRLEKRLKQLPSAQRWISCSERLPEELGDYLVSIKRVGWNCEEYVENDIAYWDDLEGFHKADKVIAWMPLPEPYKGEQ